MESAQQVTGGANKCQCQSGRGFLNACCTARSVCKLDQCAQAVGEPAGKMDIAHSVVLRLAFVNEAENRPWRA